MDFLENDPNRAWRFRNAVISQISIIDLMNKYGLHPETRETGQEFTHRSYCPFHRGKGTDGKERTPSLFISDRTNSFFCFGCVDKNELIWTDQGLKKINDIKIGELVLDHRGQYSKVLNISGKSKTVLEIETGSFLNDGLKLTPDHICMRISKEQALKKLSFICKDKSKRFGIRFKSKYKDNKNYNLQIEECFSKDLKGGDFLLFPVVQKNADAELPKIHPYNRKTKGPKPYIFNISKISVDFAWLIGIWLAEGSVGDRFLRFSLHINEFDTFGKRIMEIFEKELSVKPSYKLYPKKNICEIFVCKNSISKQFVCWFGSRSYGKRLPAEILGWPKDIQKSLIKGYLDGDGDKRNVAKTVSKELAYGLFAVAVQAGYLPSISYHKNYKDKNNIKHRESWVFYCKIRESVSGFFQVIGDTLYYLSMVHNIYPNNEIHDVIDITVENSSSFTTKMASVHNCGVSGSVIDFVSLIDGTPPLVALQKLAKDIGLIDKDGNWDELQLDALDELMPSFDPTKTIEPYLFEISLAIRSHIFKFAETENFEKELRWAEKVGAKVDEFLSNVGHEDWEYAKELAEKVIKSINNRSGE